MTNVNDNAAQSQSQKKEILAYLKSGKRLTQMDALYKFQCMRLAARISELRDEGWNIKTDKIKVPSGKIVACYYIPTELFQ